MTMVDFVTESIFSKASDPYNMKALQKMAVTWSVPESVFSKVSGLCYK